ncbi:nickel pincer cofactor biosynthesis protein LarC [Cellulomonas sp. NS3]|uniref:nickel pincer cofactor biosynthesis protein LarC n=1 Tax=Cellulomonas sp. NS3 TaxID=2973977 RepID=UPI0021619776|nr:nickel pincer cofactor biosynthesis protein LarC [Cellulomonas sp. NS3]
MTVEPQVSTGGTGRVLWVDASAGVAGDMLLGALVDAGVALDALQAAVDAVIPGSVRLTASTVTRAGLRATKVEVEVLVDDPPHRTWSTIRALLDEADLDPPVRTAALAAFARLADAEGRVHGVPPEDVHFHEVGALDAIADVVGSCAGVASLGAAHVVVSPVALGSGTIEAHHGTLPVPAPAVLELARGWDVVAGGRGELATPTGLALVTALASESGPLPAMRVERTGIGAGTRDRPDRANVLRLALGTGAHLGAPHAGSRPHTEPAVLLETNVDDLDPRLWPGVLAHLLAAGASDAWLTPILMKKGRPAHTLHVLADPSVADALRAVVLAHTTTLGVRVSTVEKDVLDRAWVPVRVDVTTAGAGPRAEAGHGHPHPHAVVAPTDMGAPGTGVVRIKVGHRAGLVVQAMPEFEDVAALADATGVPAARVLADAHAAAEAAGLVAGASWDGSRAG